MEKSISELKERIEKLPRSSRGSRLFNTSLRKEIVEAMRSSGLPIAKFAQSIGISQVILYKWKSRFKDSISDSFVPVKVVHQMPIEKKVKIHCSYGLTLEASPSQIADIIRRLHENPA